MALDRTQFKGFKPQGEVSVVSGMLESGTAIAEDEGFASSVVSALAINKHGDSVGIFGAARKHGERSALKPDIWKITQAYLDDEYQGAGIGKRGYSSLIRQIKDSKNGAFILAPAAAFLDENTTFKASRFWNSKNSRAMLEKHGLQMHKFKTGEKITLPSGNQIDRRLSMISNTSQKQTEHFFTKYLSQNVHNLKDTGFGFIRHEDSIGYKLRAMEGQVSKHLDMPGARKIISPEAMITDVGVGEKSTLQAMVKAVRSTSKLEGPRVMNNRLMSSSVAGALSTATKAGLKIR